MRRILTIAFHTLMFIMAAFCIVTLARFIWVIRQVFFDLWTR